MMQVNALFSCDLLITEYNEQLLEAVITLATSGISCTCDGAAAMVYLNYLQFERPIASQSQVNFLQRLYRALDLDRFEGF